jgi:hypothetical protein
MRKVAWIAMAAFLTLSVLIAAAIAAWLLWGLPQEIGTVSINGKVLEIDPHAGHWVLATIGILLVGLIVMAVVATVAVLALIVPLVVVPLGVAVAALGVGLVLSPLLLLIWWLWKRRAKPDTIGP